MKLALATLCLLGVTSAIEVQVPTEQNLAQVDAEEGVTKNCITSADVKKSFKKLLSKDKGKMTGWDLFGAMDDYSKTHKKHLSPE